MEDFAFPKQTISLQRLIEWSEGLATPLQPEATTRSLYNTVLAETKGRKCSLAELLEPKASSLAENQFNVVQNETYYIIHSWDQYFKEDLLSCLKNLRNSSDGDDIQVWIDLFCMNQHTINHHLRRFNWWGKEFLDALKDFDSAVLTFPIGSGNFTHIFDRSWIVWEICCVQKASVELTISLAENDVRNSATYEQTLMDKFPEIVHAIFSFDVAVTKAKDRRMHKRNASAMKKIGDRETINKDVFSLVEEFFASAGRELAGQKTTNNNVKAQYEKFLNALGYLFKNLELWDDAVEIFSLAVERIESTSQMLNESGHFNLAREYNNLAVCLRQLDSNTQNRQPHVSKNGKTAIGCLEECINSLLASINSQMDLNEATAFKLNSFIATAQHNLGNWTLEAGDLTAAQAHYQQSLACKLDLFGPENMSSASTLNGLGYAMILNREFKDAAKALRQALEVRLRLAGPTHQDTAQTQHCLALALENLGLVNRAKEQATKAYKTINKLHGADYPLTQDYKELVDKLH